MKDTDSIYENASQRATLCVATKVDCPTLQEAVIAWRNLPGEQKETATIKLANGTVYTASEIVNLYKADPAAVTV